MTNLFDDHPEASFFCDETPIGGSHGVSTDFLVTLSKKFKEGTFFWLACNHDWPSKIKLKSGKKNLISIYGT